MHVPCAAACEVASAMQCKLEGEWAHTGVEFGGDLASCYATIMAHSDCNHNMFIHSGGNSCYCFGGSPTFLSAQVSACTYIDTGYGYSTYRVRPTGSPAPGDSEIRSF